MEREKLPENAAAMGPYFLAQLKARVGDHPHVGEVRGEGLMMAVEFVADRAKRRFFKPGTAPHRVVAAKAMEQGVLARALPFVEVTSFSPPLCITTAEIDEAIDRYVKGLELATPELERLAAI